MKLKKEFASFYQEIRIDSESHVLKEKREVLEDDILYVDYRNKGCYGSVKLFL